MIRSACVPLGAANEIVESRLIRQYRASGEYPPSILAIIMPVWALRVAYRCRLAVPIGTIESPKLMIDGESRCR